MKISQCFEKLVPEANSTREIIGTVISQIWRFELGHEKPKFFAKVIGIECGQYESPTNDPTDFIPLEGNGKLNFLFSCEIPQCVKKGKKGHIFDPFVLRMNVFADHLSKQRAHKYRSLFHLCLAFTKN